MRTFSRCLLLAGFMVSPVVGENLLSIESGTALPGTQNVALDLSAKHDEPLNAFSIAIKYEPDVFAFSSLDLDSLGIITGQITYEYSRALDDPDAGVLVIGVMLDYQENPYYFREIPASPDTAQLLAKVYFSVAPRAEPGNYPFLLRNRIGTPPVENAFSVRGRTVNPDLESGSFTVQNPHHLYALDTEAVKQGTARVQIVADHGEPIQGFTIIMRYPNNLISIDTYPLDDPEDESEFDYIAPDLCKWPITWCGLGLESYLGSDGKDEYGNDIPSIESYSAWAVSNYTYDSGVPGTGTGRLYAVAIFDPTGPRDQELPPGSQVIQMITFDVSKSVAVGQEIPVTFVNGTGEPALDNMFVVPVDDKPDASVSPDLHNGKVTIVSALRGFRRGYVNTDKTVNLADAVYLLGYLFGTGETPWCLKAADTNDDGEIDLADAVKLLGFLFGGQPPLPVPFFQCGTDPSPDELTCAIEPGC
jgi:hypothetical protein